MHESQNPYQCDICQRYFGHSSQLRRHVAAVHNKERPFQRSGNGGQNFGVTQEEQDVSLALEASLGLYPVDPDPDPDPELQKQKEYKGVSHKTLIEMFKAGIFPPTAATSGPGMATGNFLPTLNLHIIHT